MPSLAVKQTFSAKDKLSGKFGKMGKASDKFGNRVEKNMRRSSQSAAKFGNILGGVFGGNLLTQGVFMLQRGIGDVTGEFIDLDAAITGAAAKFPEKIKRGSKAFNELTDAARRVGGATEFTAAEAGAGLDFLAMSGFNAAQAMAALDPMVNLATAANMDLARSSDIASDALGAFGLMSDDPIKLSKNLEHLSNVLAKTSTSANVTLETMFETMTESGPAVKTAGAGIETFAALTGKLGSAGIKGSKAGTNLKNMFLRLAAPVGKADKLLKKLSVSTIDKSTGNMRDMIDIIGDLNKATKGMGTGQRAAALDVLFGKRAISGASVLLDIGADKLREYRAELTNSKGASAELAGEMRKGLGVQLEVLKSALTEKGIDIFTKALGETDPAQAVAKLTKAVNEFNVKPIVSGIKDLAFWFKKIGGFLVENKDTIFALGKAYIGLKLTMGAMNLLNFGNGISSLSAMIGGGGAGSLVGSLGIATTKLGFMQKALGVLGKTNVVVQVGIAAYAIGSLLSNLLESHKDKVTKKTQGFENKVHMATGASSGLSNDKLLDTKIDARAKLKKLSNQKYRLSGLDRSEMKLAKDALKSIKKEEDLRKYGTGDLGKDFGVSSDRGGGGLGTDSDPYSNTFNPFKAQPRNDTPTDSQTTQSPYSAIIKGITDSLTKKSEQPVQINLSIDGVPQGTTATATVQGAPGINMAQAGSTS